MNRRAEKHGSERRALLGQTLNSDLVPSKAWRSAFACVALLVIHCCGAASLELSIRHTFNGEPLQLDAVRYQNAAGEAFSVTRASYLLNGFALERADGVWLEFTNAAAWMDAEKNRVTVRVPEVPSAAYRSVRFHLGPDATANHADPAKLAADHPLNPNLNGLHWNWQGGYIFLALEGHWQTAAVKLDGFSFHFANDTNRTRINLAAALDLTGDARMELDFDLAPLLNAPRPISFAKDGSSTHSREGDPIAAALKANLPGAFRVRRVSASGAVSANIATIKPLYLPEKFTPYRFTMSAVFPIPDLPRDNPLIEERVALGEKLFHEPRLSKDSTISCASCHDRRAAFTDPRRYSVGVRQQLGARNAMPLFNLAWRNSFFWDGRAPSLRVQALMPIQDHTEMDESLTNVVSKLAATNYPADFARAFDSPEITSEKIGLALESFVLSLTSFDSKFDRAFRGEAQLNEAEKRGFELFMTEYDPRREQYGADCFHCHGGALFQSQTFANNGLDLEPATFCRICNKRLCEHRDRGRASITGKVSDEGKFSTPSLRNIALTAPYMHDGRFATLEQVVEHYSAGVKRSATLDPNLAKHPDGGLHLSAEDQHALVAFLRTLTDEKFLSR
jgi:cytochrome c peroxidase